MSAHRTRAMGSTVHTGHKARGRQDAVVGSEHRSPQPIRAFAEVLLGVPSGAHQPPTLPPDRSSPPVAGGRSKHSTTSSGVRCATTRTVVTSYEERDDFRAVWRSTASRTPVRSLCARS